MQQQAAGGAEYYVSRAEGGKGVQGMSVPGLGKLRTNVECDVMTADEGG